MTSKRTVLTVLPIALGLALLLSGHNSLESHAASSKAESYLETAESARQSGSYKKAIPKYKKALQEFENNATTDEGYARALTGLAIALSKTGESGNALSYLKKAIDLCRAQSFQNKKLVEDLNGAFLELNNSCTIVELNSLGRGASEALKQNSSQIAIKKNGELYEVTIDSPSRFDSPTGSNTIDTIRLEKKVTFNMSRDQNGRIKATEIKGFQIRSVEKNMWVNLYDCEFNPKDQEGNYPSVISAGKMGVVKHVNRALPPRIFAPVEGIIASIDSMSAPKAPPLVVPLETVEPSTETNSPQQTETTVNQPPEEITPRENIIESIEVPIKHVRQETSPSSDEPEQQKQVIESPPSTSPVVATPETSPTRVEKQVRD
ncbi:MAG TPA: tetratricopeptide repeat protein, partial [Candidatus Melainabacteria bacterium]|nr:tetratricopeptide repeat protein [Candidatus Melainabacteria bacterium]